MIVFISVARFYNLLPSEDSSDDIRECKYCSMVVVGGLVGLERNHLDDSILLKRKGNKTKCHKIRFYL